MSAVVVALALLGGTSWGIADAFDKSDSRLERPVSAEGGVAPSVLPEPTQFPPEDRVDQAHRALHAVGRACKQPRVTRGPEAVRRPLAVMQEFARDYPRGG